MTGKVGEPGEVRFKRVLGLPALVFFGLAYMVPLTVWTTYGIVTTSTEGHLPLAYVVTTIAMFFTAYSYGRMVLAHPVAGSAYTYASRSFGRGLGFMVGWALLLDYIFLPMINYLVIGLYMQDYFPDTSQGLWVVIAVALVTGLNILGVRLLAGMNLLFVGVQFVFIAVFAVMAVVHISSDVDVQSWTAPFYDSDTNLGLVFAGAAILALSFLGFDAVSTLAEETEDPKRKIPLAIMLCALAGGAVYVFQSYLGHLAFPDFSLFADDQDVASSDVMKEIGNDFLNSFFTAAYVAGAFACAMASQASVSRILYAMGRDGTLPKTGVRPPAPEVPVAGGGEPRRRRVRPHRAVHQPGHRVLDDLVRRAGGVLVREPVGDQDLLGRPRAARRGELRQVRPAPVPRVRVHDLPVDQAERDRLRGRPRVAGGRVRLPAVPDPRLPQGAAGDVLGRGGGRHRARARLTRARCSASLAGSTASGHEERATTTVRASMAISWPWMPRAIGAPSRRHQKLP